MGLDIIMSYISPTRVYSPPTMAHLTLKIKELLADLVLQSSWAGSHFWRMVDLHLGATASVSIRQNTTIQVDISMSQQFVGMVTSHEVLSVRKRRSSPPWGVTLCVVTLVPCSMPVIPLLCTVMHCVPDPELPGWCLKSLQCSSGTGSPRQIEDLLVALKIQERFSSTRLRVRRSQQHEVLLSEKKQCRQLGMF